MSDKDDKITRAGVASDRVGRALNAYAEKASTDTAQALRAALADLSARIDRLLGPTAPAQLMGDDLQPEPPKPPPPKP